MGSFTSWDTNNTNVSAVLSGHLLNGFAVDEVISSSELNQILIEIAAGITGTINIPSVNATGDSITCAANTAGVTKDYGFVAPQGRTITGARARVLDSTAGLWGTSTPYAVGNRVEDTTSLNIYQCTTAGTSFSSGNGPSGGGTGIIDGSCVWEFVAAVSGGNATNGGTLKLELLSSLAGSVTVVATSAYSNFQGTAQTLALTGLSTTIVANTAYYARIVDVGADGSNKTIYELEIDFA